MDALRAPLPVSLRHIPQELSDILTPGRIFVARVETIEGKLLTLFVGNERLEAMLSEHIPQNLFKPGQVLKLKVTSLGPPLVLSLQPQTEESLKPQFKETPKILLKFLPKEEPDPKLTSLLRLLPEKIQNITRRFALTRTFSAKVDTIEGKLLTMVVENERFEVVLPEHLPRNFLKPGQLLKLKITSFEPPVLLFETKAGKDFEVNLDKFPQPLLKFLLEDSRLPALLRSLRHIPQRITDSPILGHTFAAKVETIEGKLLTLLVGNEKLEFSLPGNFPERFFKEGQDLKLKVISFDPPVLSIKTIGKEFKIKFKEIPQALLNLLPEESQAVFLLKDVAIHKPKESLGPLLAQFFKTLLKEKQEKQTGEGDKTQFQIREHFLKLWQEGQFIVPFLFGDRVSWSYLYEERENSNTQKGKRSFLLTLFLSRLGYLEARFNLSPKMLFLEISFAREESLAKARQALSLLYDMFSFREDKVMVKLNLLEAYPGQMLRLKG